MGSELYYYESQIVNCAAVIRVLNIRYILCQSMSLSFRPGLQLNIKHNIIMEKDSKFLKMYKGAVVFDPVRPS